MSQSKTPATKEPQQMIEFTATMTFTDNYTGQVVTDTLRVFRTTEDAARVAVSSHINTTKSFGGYTNLTLRGVDLKERTAAAPAPASTPEPVWKGMSHTEQRAYVRQVARIENERARAAYAAAERRIDFVRPVYVGSYDR